MRPTYRKIRQWVARERECVCVCVCVCIPYRNHVSVIILEKITAALNTIGRVVPVAPLRIVGPKHDCDDVGF